MQPSESISNGMERPSRSKIAQFIQKWKLNTNTEGHLVEIRKKFSNIYTFNDLNVNALSDVAKNPVRQWFRQEMESARTKYAVPNLATVLVQNSPEIRQNGYFWRTIFHVLLAYVNPLSEYYHKQDTCDFFLQLLQYSKQFLLNPNPPKQNWWAYDVCIHQYLLKILLIDPGIIPEPLFHYCAEFVLLQGFYPDHIGYLPNRHSDGVNYLWIALNQFMAGLLFNQSDFVQIMINVANEVFHVVPEYIGNGIMKDGSYHFHGNQVDMGYGIHFLEMGSVLLYLLDNTYDQLNKDALDGFSRLLSFTGWTSFKNKYYFTTRGRAASRAAGKHINGGTSDPLDFTRPVLFLHDPVLVKQGIALLSTRTIDVRESVLISAPETYYFACKQLIDNVKIEHDISIYTQGTEIFPTSSILIARDPSFFLGIQMGHQYNKAWDSIQGENMFAHQVVEGSILALTDGSELIESTQYAYLWDQLPGVTYLHSKFPHNRRKNSSAGGSVTIVGKNNAKQNLGAGGMQYQLKSLSARKSYFTIGNVLILLGSHIQRKFDWRWLDPVSRIRTTLFRWPILSQETKPIIQWENGYSHQIFYYNRSGVINLFESSNLDRIQLVEQISSMETRRMNKYYYPDCPKYTMNYIVIDIDHGFSPKEGTYGCATVLNVAKEDCLRIFNESQIVPTISDVGHAIRFGKDSDFGLGIFFQKGSLPIGSLSDSGCLLWQKVVQGQKKFVEFFIGLNLSETMKNSQFFPRKVQISLPFETLNGKNFEINIENPCGQHFRLEIV